MPELDDADKAILAALLRETIERDRFPMSPRIRSFKAILAKLDPPRRTSEPFPAPKPARAEYGTERETKAMTRFLLLAGCGCLIIMVLTHVAEALHLLPGMGWGLPDSPG